MNKRVLFVVGREIADQSSIAGTETAWRCEKALEQWAKGMYSWLLVTALEYEPGGGESVSASSLMADWFVARGVPRDQILVETHARDIYDNVKMGEMLLRARGLEALPLTTVTEMFNALRCWILFVLLYRKWTRFRPLPKRLPIMRFVRELLIVAYLFYDWQGTKAIARGNREMMKRELI